MIKLFTQISFLSLMACQLGIAAETLTSNVTEIPSSELTNPFSFTDADIHFLKQFSLSNLPDAPKSISNRFADRLDAAQLGKQLFFDKRLSKNGLVSCANCHQPNKYFTDGLAHSIALGETHRSAPSIIGASHSPWQFWDGRKDSLWAQALAPIEDAKEHGLTRTEFVTKIIRFYSDDYQKIFGAIPEPIKNNTLSLEASPLGNTKQQNDWQSFSNTHQDHINRVFSNAGKAIMAYQRKLVLPKAKFDNFIDQLSKKQFDKLPSLFSSSEVNGLRLFVGKANCASCHNGPLFTNYEFHNIGAPEVDTKKVDMGRFIGVTKLVSDEFTCLSKWSDASQKHCEEMRFLKKNGPELVGAFKTPTLRNIAETSPYMQGGQFKSLEDVVAHYNLPTPPLYDPTQHPNRPHFDILPLQLTEKEAKDLVNFLKTLTSPLDQVDHWWQESANSENVTDDLLR